MAYSIYDGKEWFLMKYIRTKNRIYQVESVLKDNGFVKGYNVGEMAFIRKDQVINQSENLDELCDEFVGYVGEEYVKENETYDMPNFQEYNLKDMLYHMSYDKEDCVVYGAIWTSKGLIYVAKMNENGELELI